jgi:hypothetical protein
MPYIRQIKKSTTLVAEKNPDIAGVELGLLDIGFGLQRRICQSCALKALRHNVEKKKDSDPTLYHNGAIPGHLAAWRRCLMVSLHNQ